jgi:mono/diheme cytochrome c family protein
MRPAVVLIAFLLAACSRGPDEGAAAPTAADAGDTRSVADLPATGPSGVGSAGPGDAVEGARVARRVGCDGCHGEGGRGEELWGEPGKFQVRSPNLTVKRDLYDDDGLVALLREGRTHDGHRPLGMPVFMFQHLSDREVRDIVAWVRALPEIDNPGAGVSWYGEEIQQQLRDGTYPYDDDKPRPGIVAPAVPPAEPLALGRHLAYTSCTECHGDQLEGWGGGDPAPSLVVVAKAYTPAAFARLMRTGKAANGEDTATMMSGVARWRFSPMTDEEIAALKLYLDSR